jgi:hypothetical protein
MAETISKMPHENKLLGKFVWKAQLHSQLDAMGVRTWSGFGFAGSRMP